MNKFHAVVAVILTELAKASSKLPPFEVACYPDLGEFEIGMESANLGLNIAYLNKGGSEELYVDFNDEIGGFSIDDGTDHWTVDDIEGFIKDVFDCATNF